MAMEPHQNSCKLKVNIKHCTDCQEKAVKKLEKMDGVDSVTYDTRKGLLRVSGNIDPVVLINKFAEWGKKAELYSFQKDSKKANQSKCKCCYCKNKADDDKSKELVSSDCQSTKKGKKLFGLGGWFGKDDEAKPKTSGSKSPPAKWHFPRTFMPEYGAPGPFGPPPFVGIQGPGYMNQYAPPMMFPRPVSHYDGYGMIPLPPDPPQPPAPYGYFQSGPPFPPNMNPMIPDPPQPATPYGHFYFQSRPPLPPNMNPMILDPPQPPTPYGYFQSGPPLPPNMNPMIHYTGYEDNNFYHP